MTTTWHNDTLTRGSQSWTRTVTLTVAGHKARVVVNRDSYDVQSRIYSEVFSPTELKWNRLETRAGKEYGDLPGAYTRPDKDIEIIVATNELVNDMIDYAELILL